MATYYAIALVFAALFDASYADQNQIIKCNWPFDVRVRIPGIDKFTFKECTQKGEYELYQCGSGKEFDAYRMQCVPAKGSIQSTGYRPQPQTFVPGQLVTNQQSNFGTGQPFVNQPQTNPGSEIKSFEYQPQPQPIYQPQPIINPPPIQPQSQQITTNSVGAGGSFGGYLPPEAAYPIELHSQCTEGGYCPFDPTKLQYCNFGGSRFMQCSGTGWVVKDCPHGTTFSQGRCRDPRNFLGNFVNVNQPQPIINQQPPPIYQPRTQQNYQKINSPPPTQTYQQINTNQQQQQTYQPQTQFNTRPQTILGQTQVRSQDPQIQRIIFQQVPAPPSLNRYIVQPSQSYNTQESRQPVYVRQHVQTPTYQSQPTTYQSQCCGGNRGRKEPVPVIDSEYYPYYDNTPELLNLPNNWGTTGSLGQAYEGPNPSGHVNYITAARMNPREMFSKKKTKTE